MYKIGDPLSCPTSTSVEQAFNSTASRHFNTKVNASNQTERILILLMTGLTFRDWHMHVKNNSLDGIPPDLTEHGMNCFEYRHEHQILFGWHTNLRITTIVLDCMLRDQSPVVQGTA